MSSKTGWLVMLGLALAATASGDSSPPPKKKDEESDEPDPNAGDDEPSADTMQVYFDAFLAGIRQYANDAALTFATIWPYAVAAAKDMVPEEKNDPTLLDIVTSWQDDPLTTIWKMEGWLLDRDKDITDWLHRTADAIIKDAGGGPPDSCAVMPYDYGDAFIPDGDIIMDDPEYKFTGEEAVAIIKVWADMVDGSHCPRYPSLDSAVAAGGVPITPLRDLPPVEFWTGVGYPDEKDMWAAAELYFARTGKDLTNWNYATRELRFVQEASL